MTIFPSFFVNKDAAAHQIEQSLRFDGSSYLTRTTGPDSNRKTWTISFWVKYGKDTTNRMGFFGVPAAANENSYFQWYVSNYNLKVSSYSNTQRRSTAFYRDYSSWYHVVLRSDTTQASESDRLRMYVNGELIDGNNTAQSLTSVAQNFNWAVNVGAAANYIGSINTSEYLFNGYLAEYHLIDGSSLPPTTFGEYDTNGVWRPIEVQISQNSGTILVTTDAASTGGSLSDINDGSGNYYSNTGSTIELEFGTTQSGVTSIKFSGGGFAQGSTYDLYVNDVLVADDESTNSGWSEDTITISSTDITKLKLVTSGGYSLGSLKFNNTLVSGNPALSTYGTNGFYLTFDPTATNGIGHDHSGNGNNFTASGFTTSGTGTDVMSDTPTTNWCTLSPLGGNQQTRHTLSEGNLKYTQSASTGNAATMNSQGTIGVSSGKWYWEISDSENSVYGFMQSQQEAGNYQTTGGWVYYMGSDGYGGVTNFSHSNGISTTDVIGMALDMDNKTCACYKNNTLMGTFTTIPDGTYFPTGSVNSSSTSGRATYNFGQRAFTYTPPSGFKPLNTANLPAPTVKAGSKYFDSVLFNAGTTTVTGVGHQPDFVWAKNRTQSYNHRLIDVVRGVKNDLYSNATSDEQTNQSDSLLTFTSDGFTHGKFGSADADNFVAWSWKAGGSVSADNNTDGTITSTVSASPTSGFSIVGWNGTGSNGTVGHGLGVAPSVVIVKNRDDNTKGWPFQFTDLGNNYLEINNGSNTFTGSTYFQNTAPTSTVFSVGSIGSTNGSGNKMIAYCFAEVDGFFKVGTYSGTGSDKFIYCGFKPALIVIKSSNTSSRRWEAFDSTINTENPANERISWSETGVATDYTTPDILSNGFNLKGAGGYTNDSGNDYVWMAWAENPFGGDGVSPATAR